jgi:hypothetical protein
MKILHEDTVGARSHANLLSHSRRARKSKNAGIIADDIIKEMSK